MFIDKLNNLKKSLKLEIIKLIEKQAYIDNQINIQIIINSKLKNLLILMTNNFFTD